MAAFAPEVLFHIGLFPITNTVLNTILVDSVLVGSALYIGKNIKRIPGKFQNLIEMVIDGFYNLTESVAGKNAAQIFPWFMSFFFFILIANWSGLLPGAGSIGFYQPVSHTTEVKTEETVKALPSEGSPAVTDEHAPVTTDTHTEKTTQASETTDSHEKPHLTSLMRNATSELNVTLALALISLVATHALSIKTIGIKDYLLRFFSFNPILLFVGLLELVSEFTKIVSLSFRLFGNIYAGEVVLHTISKLFAFVFPLPFIFLEIIVGLVQALVFGMLTMVFMSVMMTSHNSEEHAEHK